MLPIMKAARAFVGTIAIVSLAFLAGCGQPADTNVQTVKLSIKGDTNARLWCIYRGGKYYATSVTDGYAMVHCFKEMYGSEELFPPIRATILETFRDVTDWRNE